MAIARYILSIVVVLVALFLGCQHAALAYWLHRDGPDPVMFPPSRGKESAESPALSVAIRNARQASTNRADCDIAGDLISLHWDKTIAEVSFQSRSFFAGPADESADSGVRELSRRMYLDPLVAIDKFRFDLADRQSKGCLRATESDHLRRAIVEDLPLPPVVAYFLQMGSYDVTGYFDLTPDFRMQVTSPIYPDGTKPSPADLLGYETADYTFVREGSENRTSLHLSSATETLIGGAPVEKRTLRNELPFSKSPGYFRLLFMTEESESNRITRAILLSAPDEPKLAQAVAHRGTTPDDFCTKLSVAAVTCTVFPKNFGAPRARQSEGHLRAGWRHGPGRNKCRESGGSPASIAQNSSPVPGTLDPHQI
jgi:hypothetical protein